jgi:hypothetical protein
MNKKYWIAFAVLIILYAIVSEQSYQDEIVNFKHTCAMIEGGYWPAEGIYKFADEEIEKCRKK